MKAMGVLIGVVVLSLLLIASFPGQAQQPAQPGAAGYVLGPGDVIEVSVWGNENLSRTVTVRPDGKISLPLLGDVAVAGLTPTQAEARLIQLFKTYLKNPRVTVIVVQFRKIRVAVLGKVLNPGPRELPPGSTLVDAISQAGGVDELAAEGQAYLIREGREIIALNLRLALSGDPSANLVLSDRDVIIVPQTASVYVVGEVAKPGVYPLRNGLTLLDVLLQAGGLTDRASLAQARLLRNRTETIALQLDPLLLKGDLSANVAMQAGDVVFIPEDTEIRVYVLGQVATPGAYPYRNARTLLQALTAAGGPTPTADLRGAYVVRRTTAAQPNESPMIRVDLDALIRKGDLSKDIPLQAGDVLYVPQQFLSTVSGILQLIISILTGVRGLGP